jgi:uncharacterized membrane protein YphA (DoxX/SURF4 family)
MNTTTTDSRHQDWIRIEAMAVKWLLAAVALLMMTIPAFIMANRSGAPEDMVTLTMVCFFGAMATLMIAVCLTVIAAIIRRRVTAKIKFK